MSHHRPKRQPRTTEEIAQAELDKAEEMEYAQQHDEADYLRNDAFSRLKMAEKLKEEAEREEREEREGKP